MGKAIKYHFVNGNGKTFCGLNPHNELPIATIGKKAQFINKRSNELITSPMLCVNCCNRYQRHPIGSIRYELAMQNELIAQFEQRLPDTPIAYRKYKKTRIRKAINNKPLNSIPQQTTESDEPIELTDEVIPEDPKPIESGYAIAADDESSIDIIKEDLQLVAANDGESIELEAAPQYRMINQFGQWKAIARCVNPNSGKPFVRDLTGWTDRKLAYKIFNSAVHSLI